MKKYLRVITVGLLPAFVYLVPREWLFDEGHTLCLFRNVTGQECWGCGMTRALASLAYLDFQAAWEYNRLVVVVAPLLLYIWVKWIMRLINAAKGRA
ncbi:MAG: DUF2752 domain-containing protein [Alistipes sp.]|nr:DUF2752 domain-containing protein [Alistipes sp.]